MVDTKDKAYLETLKVVKTNDESLYAWLVFTKDMLDGIESDSKSMDYENVCRLDNEIYSPIHAAYEKILQAYKDMEEAYFNHII